MANASDNVASALSGAAQAINVSSSLEDTLDGIVHAVLVALPEFDHAGISIIHRDGRIETLCGTDQFVWDLDELQYSLAEGPCVDAMREERVVIVEGARHDQRWPNYMPQAARRGLRAQLALQVYTGAETIGGLNLYSTESEAVPPESLQVADLFATHAAIALGQARTEDQLHQAASGRKVIGQAMGIVSERYQIPEERAFQFLVRASQTSNVKLRLVAAEIVAATNEKYAASPG
ncbi:GAF and ANTAR domain-containing protein [Nocardioides houyundeii]|uniref:GAF and ANTAR domain-containing protein n=1 Tax=Nocardioides houyundeii TaxID=2045452 RepID=UPI000C77CF03|nr:GAF and ANTAR domain-containing protein [Nocardioides houyundeii]